jgi:hypothetical protein
MTTKLKSLIIEISCPGIFSHQHSLIRDGKVFGDTVMSKRAGRKGKKVTS